MGDIYDLAIIGGGPAGYTAAERAGHAGLKTVLFNGGDLGGVCLNEGCIPSKVMLHSAKLYDTVRHAEAYGVTVSDARFDLEKLIKRRTRIVKTLTAGVAAALKENRVEVIHDSAVIGGRRDGTVTVQAGGAEWKAANVLIAAGGETALPPVKGIERALTHRDVLLLKEKPERLVVVGGGYIGIEFATFFRSIGTEVVVVEMLDRILPGVDGEVALFLQQSLEKKGMVFQLSSVVREIRTGSVVLERGGKTIEIQADRVLVATGRKPRLAGIGLENIGVESDSRGIFTDPNMKTNVPGVYAAGDVAGRALLAHKASREGEVAVNSILGKPDHMRYSAIPSVVYTSPEIAVIGLSAEEAVGKGIDASEIRVPLRYSGRYQAEYEGGNGFCKLVAEKRTGRILGFQMIDGMAGEMIFGLAILIEMEMSVADLRQIVFPHPTVSEAIREAAWKFVDSN